MLALAQERLNRVKKRFPKAALLDPNDVNVIYLTTQDPALYAEYAVASASRGRHESLSGPQKDDGAFRTAHEGITRQFPSELAPAEKGRMAPFSATTDDRLEPRTKPNTELTYCDAWKNYLISLDTRSGVCPA